MGLLRTLFAISVVLGHCWPTGILLIGGQNAVQLFYMISGFLISYILVEKKSYPHVLAFYSNRYLRLYPVYCVVALAALLLAAAQRPSQLFATYSSLPASAISLLTFSNLTLIGQDWVMFSAITDGHLHFAENFRASEVLLYHGLLVPQAWTLGVELTFYFVAPFVLTNRRTIYCLLVGSIALRLLFVAIGIGHQDPWTCRFFPTELALFLLGAIAHQVLLPIYRTQAEHLLRWASKASVYTLAGITCAFSLFPTFHHLSRFALFSIFFFALPLTFIYQQQRKADVWIGNLSYPIYICHMLVITIVSAISWRLGLKEDHAVAAISVIASIALAVALDRFIARPFEQIRARLRARSQTVD